MKALKLFINLRILRKRSVVCYHYPDAKGLITAGDMKIKAMFDSPDPRFDVHRVKEVIMWNSFRKAYDVYYYCSKKVDGEWQDDVTEISFS